MTDPTVMRAWLREHRPDLGVKARGKLSAHAIDVYNREHPKTIENSAAAQRRVVNRLRIIGGYRCGYCNTRHQAPKHELCPGIIDGALPDFKPITCSCASADPASHPRMLLAGDV